MRLHAQDTAAKNKEEIQRLLREIVILRDRRCILSDIRPSHDSVLQADHLITRANSATYSDSRLVVLVCRKCHGWKHWWKEEYDDLVKTLISKERVELWERAKTERRSHRAHKMNWIIEIAALNQELKRLS